MLQDIEASKAGQEATEAGTAKTKAETKVINFTNWLNDAKRNMTYWKDGESGNYADAQAQLEFQRISDERVRNKTKSNHSSADSTNEGC